MEYLTMNRKEREQSKTFELVKTKAMTQKAAAIKLGVSQRWVQKKIKRYMQDGDIGLIHKSRGKPSERRWSAEQEAILLNLLRNEWHDFGPTFSAEKLKEFYKIDISKETVRKVMIKNNLWKPKINRFKHRKRRERKEMLGIMIQLDGSPHDWFEGRAGKCTLLVFIDDATSQILWLEFASNESVEALMQATKNYIEKFGAPHMFYTDHGSVFHVNVSNKEDDKKTQWERAVEQLGSKVIHAHSPQAKGRVERCNQTMQDRLIKEMRLKNISSIEDANSYLKTSDFIAKHNQKYAITAQQSGDAHRTVIGEKLADIFSIKETRLLTNDYILHYHKKMFQLHKNQPIVIQPKNIIVIQTDLQGAITLWFRKKKLSYSVVQSRSQPEEKIVQDRIHKPSKNSRRWVGGNFPILNLESRVKSALTAAESTC